ncbi:DUF2922 domain-containing protein [Lacticaseibacillus nasuensis]|uniref:DUF2922 domain-containing protein n=1 Tax=Lacticaseibacillus nasuensis JCM 17158 TaxID=1291734 RepID=A0A0R1JS46_9LACO|nr:DUF2922 domain-containing protein [Lacticaseibacillus nasuensis]KRK74094.1 hypothetical protein FD02_GL001418 [Lacticaseibacillus nasuensis JCM 17158]MCX2455076.1 DUF2922 domain-containing protein [Lacticaseibacillus nasuensis]
MKTYLLQFSDRRGNLSTLRVPNATADPTPQQIKNAMLLISASNMFQVDFVNIMDRPISATLIDSNTTVLFQN